jgi:hypothetical protein
MNATNRFLSKPKHDANEAGLRSGLDSLIGVIESQNAESKEVIP